MIMIMMIVMTIIMMMPKKSLGHCANYHHYVNDVHLHDLQVDHHYHLDDYHHHYDKVMMTNMSLVDFMFCLFSTQPNGVLCTRGFDTFTFICGNNFVI